jgi:diacylglycerol kinase family enzyme
MAETITTFKTEQCKLMLDHQDISGEYLMVEVMNTKALGHRLKFNPQGDPGDGWLDVVRINKENSDSLVSYINSLLNEEFDKLPSVETQRGRRLDMVWSGTFAMHADAEVIPAEREGDQPGLFPVSVEIIPAAFELWMPSKPVEDGEGKN